jgi:ribosomal protein S18 acetylase RimI-like enzyme
MSGTIVHGALWANDLQRLGRPDPNRGDYVLMETRWRVADLAGAMEVPASVVRERLERGCRAFVARSRVGGVAAWMWVSTGQEWAPPLRQGLRFAPDECYAWNGGTLPEHRGRGLLTALLRFAGWRMARNGHRLMWAGIEDSNLASQRSSVAAGFRAVLRLTAIHEPPPTRLHVRPADYADERLVERALRALGGERPHIVEYAAKARPADAVVELAAGRWS